MQKNESSAKSATDIVMAWQQGVERRDYQSVRGLLSNNISYVSPLNSFDGAEPYLKYLEHVNLPKFDIKKEFADSNDVCILHEYKVGTLPVTSLVCVVSCRRSWENKFDQSGFRSTTLRSGMSRRGS
jgi:hypothetical protein